MRDIQISALLSEENRMQTELKEKERRIGDLEMALRPLDYQTCERMTGQDAALEYNNCGLQQ